MGGVVKPGNVIIQDKEVDDEECPLCSEKLDPEDHQFRPCSCSFKMCRFCWYRFFLGEKPECPMCRRAFKNSALLQLDTSSPIAQLEKLRAIPERGETAFQIIRTSAYFDPNLDIPTYMFDPTTTLIEILFSRGLIQVSNNDYSRMRTKEPIVTAVRRSADPLKVLQPAMGPLYHAYNLNLPGMGWVKEKSRDREQRIKLCLQHGLYLWDHIIKSGDKFLMNTRFFGRVCLRLEEIGLYSKALDVAKETLPIFQRLFGRFEVNTLHILFNVAATLSLLGRKDEGLGILNEILEPARESLGLIHEITLVIRVQIGVILMDKGQLEEALEISNEVCVGFSTTHGPTHSLTLLVHFGKGQLLFKMGRYAEALEVFKATYDHLRRILDKDSLLVLSIQSWIGKTIYQEGNYDAALIILSDVYAKQLTRLDPDELRIFKSGGQLIRCLNRLEHYAESVRVFNELGQRYKESGPPMPWNDTHTRQCGKFIAELVNVLLEYGKGLLGLKRKGAAKRALTEVLKIYKALGVRADSLDGNGSAEEVEELIELCRCHRRPDPRRRR